MSGRRAYGPQAGQALVEALLALAVLGVLFALQGVVGRLQDQALGTGMEARAAAFAVAYGLPSAPAGMRREDEGGLPVRARLGQDSAAASALRGELLSGTGGLPLGLVKGEAGVVADLRSLDARRLGIPEWAQKPPGLSSRYAILDGAGHADSAEAARKRLAQSASAWTEAAQGTQKAARALSAMERVDAPWGRPRVEEDWLSRWAGKVPGDLLAERP